MAAPQAMAWPWPIASGGRKSPRLHTAAYRAVGIRQAACMCSGNRELSAHHECECSPRPTALHKWAQLMLPTAIAVTQARYIRWATTYGSLSWQLYEVLMAAVSPAQLARGSNGYSPVPQSTGWLHQVGCSSYLLKLSQVKCPKSNTTSEPSYKYDRTQS
jgi:hypothetical protein